MPIVSLWFSIVSLSFSIVSASFSIVSAASWIVFGIVFDRFGAVCIFDRFGVVFDRFRHSRPRTSFPLPAFLYYYRLLGAPALAQRKGDWVASCGVDRVDRAGKLEQQNAGRTRNLRVVFFSFVLSIARAPTATEKSKCRSKFEQKIDRKSNKNRSKIKQKSISGRLGAIRGRSGIARRPLRGRSGTSREPLGSAPGVPKSAPGRSVDAPGRTQNALGALRHLFFTHA